MAKPTVEVALRLTGQGFAPEEVTKLVGLAQTKAWRQGDPVQMTQLKRKHDGWAFGLPKRETYDMEGLLRELLDAVDPHKASIHEAVTRFNLETEISFGVYIRDEAPATWFAAATIYRVSDLGAGLDIDLILTE